MKATFKGNYGQLENEELTFEITIRSCCGIIIKVLFLIIVMNH
jgi:hypothetical protein